KIIEYLRPGNFACEYLTVQEITKSIEELSEENLSESVEEDSDEDDCHKLGVIVDGK
ncbi:19299_t:CDS:2, partial [Racocetra persica]